MFRTNGLEGIRILRTGFLHAGCNDVWKLTDGIMRNDGLL